MRRLFLLTLGVLALGLPAAAQSPASGYVLKFYMPNATASMQQQSFPASATSCNKPASPTTAPVNPGGIEWTDEDNPTNVCVYRFVPGDTLFALPLGKFEATISVVNDVGPSPESLPRVPFTHDAARKAPTALRFVK